MLSCESAQDSHDHKNASFAGWRPGSCMDSITIWKRSCYSLVQSNPPQTLLPSAFFRVGRSGLRHVTVPPFIRTAYVHIWISAYSCANLSTSIHTWRIHRCIIVYRYRQVIIRWTVFLSPWFTGGVWPFKKFPALRQRTRTTCGPSATRLMRKPSLC
jgi:hypothetical protein